MEEKLSNKEMAELIADALFSAKILNEKDINKAIEIVTQEIVARKAIGDF